MKSGGFYDFLFGKAEFIAKDGFADEFIEACSRNKIRIFNFIRKGRDLTGSVRFADIDALEASAEKCGMRLEIIKRYGLPHIFYRYRKRFGIPVGLLIFAIISAVLHSVVWTIDITPTEFIPLEQIEEALNEAGAHVGIFADSVDCKEAEYKLYEKFEDISWVNVRIAGTRMFVSVSEVKAKEKQKESRYTNIVALKDGEIVNAEIFRGEGKLFPGTAVVGGDLLVSGILNHRDGSVQFVDSEAEIYARTNSYISSEAPLYVNVKGLVKCKDIYFPSFFGISLLDLLPVKGYDFTLSSCFIDGGDVVFPVGIIRKHFFRLEDICRNLSENESALLCFRDFSFLALKLYKKAEIISSEISYSSDNATRFSGSFTCIEDIALKKEFTVEDITPSR